ncbi:hypothetical protein ACFW04_004731 [Cataglyphis niger]
MAQNLDTIAGPSRIISDENYNGLRICKKDISIELLMTIFCYIDHRTLLKCQLVCKQWKMVIQDYVWWKKAGLVLDKSFSRCKEIPWQVFYLIYKTKPPFEKNLLKNHSGEECFRHWVCHNNLSTNWTIENPPSGVPELPLTEPIFEGKQYCFACFCIVKETVEPFNIKYQTIDLEAEGFHPYILDVLQPPIMISEWYSCQNNFPAVYQCLIKLLGYVGKNSISNILDTFQFTDIIEGEKLGKWHNISHVFANYGRGLRTIIFAHRGIFNLPIKEPISIYHGSKMAGGCIRVKIP